MTDRSADTPTALADRPLTPARAAELALHLEVAATPAPGNVDRERDHADLHFEHFLAGAVGAGPGLARAADPSAPLGEAFETAVAGMSRQSGGNTQFGALLLLCPLVRATVIGTIDRDHGDLIGTAEPGDGDDGGATVTTDPPTADDVAAVVEATTVDDAVAFYRAFGHVDVAVDEPPEGHDALDVRRGGAAEAALRERGLTLADVMALSADRDGVAAEWVGETPTGADARRFARSFDTAARIVADEGPVTDRAARAHLALLAAASDTFVATGHDEGVATAVRDRAAGLHEAGADRESVTRFAETLVARGVNPGTTADVVAAGLYLALLRGVVP